MTFGFANGAMSAAFRVAFNDSFDAGGDGNNLKPLVDRGKAEALVDNVFTFQGSIENRKIARSMAIDIAQTQEGYDALAYGLAQNGITVKVFNNNSTSSTTLYNSNAPDIINLNLGSIGYFPDTAGGYIPSGGIRAFAHEIGHVARGGIRNSFEEQFVTDKFENPITRSLNAISPGFGQRGDYNSFFKNIPKGANVYK